MFVCPFCGEMINDNAKACPSCGSDETTGWRQAFLSEDLWDDHEELSGKKYPRGFLSRHHPAMIILLICLVIMLLVVFLYRTIF